MVNFDIEVEVTVCRSGGDDCIMVRCLGSSTTISLTRQKSLTPLTQTKGNLSPVSTGVCIRFPGTSSSGKSYIPIVRT